jgi:hypothetical protein
VARWLSKVSSLLKVRIVNKGYGLATWDGVMIQLWRGPATLQAAQDWLEAGEAFVLESAGRLCSNLSIVESSSPPPADNVRLALAASFQALAPRMRHQIVVAEGSVSRSALVRAVGLTLSNLSVSSLPLHFAVSLDEAALTIAPDLSRRAGGADALKNAVSDLRMRIGDFSS